MAKKNILIGRILTFAIWLLPLLGTGQDLHFSQFYASPLYLSPSLAGATDGGRLIVNYRNQWPEISKTYETFALSFDNFFTRFNSGIGGYITHDKAGSAGLTTTNFGLQYSYNLVLNSEWQVVPAIQFAYGRKSIDFSKLKFGDQLIAGGGASGSMGRLGNDQVNYADFATSLFLYSSKYWIGITVDHLSQPNYTFLNEEMRLKLKLVCFGGMNIWTERRRSRSLDQSFSFSFRYQRQARYNQLDLGVYWFSDPIEIGMWYRGVPVVQNSDDNLNHDALVALLGYKYGAYRLAYSYDISISSLGWSTGGAHELSIIWEFNQRINLRQGGKRPAVPCSQSANPLSSKGGVKYKKKRRRLF